MPKPGIHPEWYPEAPVYCEGKVVMTVGSTKPQLHVEIWSGNHPFYTGTQKIVDTEGRVERFMRKYSRPTNNATSAKGAQSEAKAGQEIKPVPKTGKPAKPAKKK